MIILFSQNSVSVITDFVPEISDVFITLSYFRILVLTTFITNVIYCYNKVLNRLLYFKWIFQSQFKSWKAYWQFGLRFLWFLSARVRGNEIAEKLARSGSLQQFVGPEPFLGVSRQNIRRKMKHCMKKQHLALWHVPCSTQRQARELISSPNLATGARLLSFNRIQSRVVIGLLTGHNTLRRHLYI